jgi:hypothetical protein
MDPKVILTALVIVIIVGTLLYRFVFKKSDEPKPEIEVTGPSPDEDEIVTDEDEEEIVPDEEETSLDNAPTEGEVEEETTGEVSPYMIKK